MWKYSVHFCQATVIWSKTFVTVFALTFLCQPQYTVYTCNSSHAAGLGAHTVMNAFEGIATSKPFSSW